MVPTRMTAPLFLCMPRPIHLQPQVQTAPWGCPVATAMRSCRRVAICWIAPATWLPC